MDVKKKILAVIILIIIAIYIIDIISRNTIDDDPNNCLRTFESLWGFDFKKAEKLVYYDTDVDGWHGDGYTYAIVEYGKKINPKELFKWETLEKRIKKSANDILNHLEVEEKYKPNYKECYYYWKENNQNEIYIIIDRKDFQKLYIIESRI